MVIPWYFFILFVFPTALIHALQEIQIEGAHGWADKLPTKKIDNRVVRTILGVHLTWYHILMSATIALCAHIGIFFTANWGIHQEFFVFGFLFLHFTLEDFFWFVFNPAFGIRNFKKEKIWWHTRWFLGIPMGYWISAPVGIILLLLSVSK